MLRKTALGLIAAASLGAAALVPSAASAHGFHGGWGHHGWGPRGPFDPDDPRVGTWLDRDVPPAFQPMLEAWHRKAHGQPDAAPSQPPAAGGQPDASPRP